MKTIVITGASDGIGAEMARQPWPVTPQQAATWAFNPDTQTWSKP